MSQTALPAAADLDAVLAAAGEGAAAQAQVLCDLVLGGHTGSAEASHAEAGHGREHTLLAAALAYCLGYELRAAGAAVEPDLLRLAALAHDLALPEAALSRLPAQVRGWVEDRRLFFDALPGSPFQLSAFASPAEQALYAAHLVASLPLPVAPNQPAARAFAAHPLGRGQPLATLALVAGGVVDGDEYVFEAPRPRAVRGASALLRRLGRVDVPALFGARFAAPADDARAQEIRAWFAARWGLPPLDAPECLLHVDDSSVLALAPAALAAALPAAIEALYAEQTLSALAVAVARRCDPLELQYGLEPTRFWRLEYEAAQADADLRLLVADERRFEAPLAPASFPPGKGFGELVAAVELLRQRRRDERAQYPNWETPVYARRCPACERRAAATRGPDGEPLCEPCARKAAVGSPAVAGRSEGSVGGPLAASPAGGAEPAITANERERAVSTATITGGSRPAGYVGLILADVAEARDHLEHVRAPTEYRAFSHRLATAMEQAVDAALGGSPAGNDGGLDLPCEVLELSGNRALLLVAGQRALGAASTLGRAFEARFALPAEGDPWAPHRYHPPRGTRGGEAAVGTPTPTELTLSAGVVIAPRSASLLLLHDLARQLLASAQRARAQAGRERPDPHRGGYCDFLVLRGDGLPATRLADWRATQSHRERRDAPELRLFAAPYTWPELEGLLLAARQLGRLGLSPADRQRLRDALTRGEAASSVDYLSYRTRAAAPVRQALSRLDEAWRGRGGRADVAPPWRGLPPGPDRRERRETVLADALTLAEVSAADPSGSAHATP
jgi:CRISPR-associated protein Cmr2